MKVLMPSPRCCRRGFTLVELLVAITIIAILAAGSIAGLKTAFQAAKKTKEMSAGRSLVAAYLAAAVDNNGILPAGYNLALTATTSTGASVPYPGGARYPWRLAPYFGYDMDDTVLTSYKKGEILPNDIYKISLNPSFGINGYAVGGYGANPDPNVVITRAAGNQVLFATSKYTAGGVATPGYHIIKPPKSSSGSWASSYNENGPDSDTGSVDFRYGKHAVVAFLDGRVAVMSFDELNDMTLWSKVAAETGDKNYQQPAP